MAIAHFFNLNILKGDKNIAGIFESDESPLDSKYYAPIYEYIKEENQDILKLTQPGAPLALKEIYAYLSVKDLYWALVDRYNYFLKEASDIYYHCVNLSTDAVLDVMRNESICAEGKIWVLLKT